MARLEAMSLDFNTKVDDLNKKVENIPVGGGGAVVVRVSFSNLFFFSFLIFIVQYQLNILEHWYVLR